MERKGLTLPQGLARLESRPWRPKQGWQSTANATPLLLFSLREAPPSSQGALQWRVRSPVLPGGSL